MLNSSQDTALISDSSRLSLISAVDCRLQTLVSGQWSSSNGGGGYEYNDIGHDFQADYAIGLRLNSPFLADFEHAIQYLTESGRLEALIDTYWADHCQGPGRGANHAGYGSVQSGAASHSSFLVNLLGTVLVTICLRL